MSRRGWIPRLGLAAAVLGLVFGCGKDPVEPPATVLVPEAWSGLWDITLTSRECGLDSVIGVDLLVDSVCTGGTLADFLGLEDDEVELECTGTWTDTELAATCSGTSTTFGCDFDIAGSVTATLNGSNFSGIARLNLRLNCDGDTSSDCIDAELSATRIGPEPASCPQPAAGLLSTLQRRGQPGRGSTRLLKILQR